MATFNLSTFPDVCRLCLQSKHPDELVSVDTVRPLFDRKLADLLEELTFKIPAKVIPYFPVEVCSMCLEVVDFFYKYKQKMNFVHQFLVAFVEVKLGSDHSLRKLFEDHNVYFSILFKDLDLCNKDDLLVEDMLKEYSQYKIASMPFVKQELPPETVSEEQEEQQSSESDSYEFQVEVLEEKESGALLVERFLEKLGHMKQNAVGEKIVEIKAEPVQLIESEEPGEIEELIYSDSENLDGFSETLQKALDDDEKSIKNNTNSFQKEEMEVVQDQAEQIEQGKQSEIFKCTKCKYRTMFRNALAVHDKRHKEYDHLEGIHCRHPSCLRVFDTKEEFQKHLKEGLHKLHVCDICGATLKHKYSLEVHLSRHAGTTRFNCTYCSSSFYTKTELQNHVRSIHTTGERWECPKCGSVFKNRKLLNQHLESHVEQRKFKCDSCEFAFKTLQHLRRHISTVHKAIRFKCEHCSVSYGRKDKLRMHTERVHNIQSYFICDICVRTFSDASSLAEHKSHHANPKPLECPVCLLTFENNKSYNGHPCITYRDDYVCCGKDFKVHINYNRHMLSEHGIKTNARVRPPSGKLMGNLRAHRRRNVSPLCRMCGKECSSLMDRRKHETICGSGKRGSLLKVSSEKTMVDQESGDEMGEEEHLIEDEMVEFIIDEDADKGGVLEC